MELKIAFRNLIKRPFLNSVKVLGLSLALSGALVIVLFVLNQLSYDRFHQKSDRIYRLTTAGQNSFSEKHFAKIFNPAFLPAMVSHFPEIENYVRLVPILGGVIKNEDQFIKVGQAFQCDSAFFKIFDAKLLVGNPETILDHPGSMVITESFSKRAFGNADPIGKILTVPSGQFYGDSFNFVVQGIMKDFPQNSHFHPEFIAAPVNKAELDRVAWTYLLLNPNADPKHIEDGFEKFYSTKVDSNPDNRQIAQLQIITDIHLKSDKLREIEANSSMSVVYTLLIAAALLSFIAIINFINLNIGMTVFSEKFLTISKIIGAEGQSVTRYFLFESILICVASVVVSLGMIETADIYIIKKFALHLVAGNWNVVMIGILIFCLIVVCSGLLLSIRRSILKLRSGKNQTKPERKGISMSLIVVQNVISICLVVAVIIIYRQTDYALSKSLGEGNDLVCFQNVHSDVQSKFGIFKSELLKHTSIKSVSAMLDQPGGEANDMMPFTLEGYVPPATDKSNDNLIGVLPCDYSFAGIFNLKFLSGANFTEKNTDNDGSGEYIINESAMKRLNYTDADKIIGKEFSISFGPSINIPKGKIIGVVKDFHLSSLKKKVEPLVLFKRHDQWLLNFIVAFQPGLELQGLEDMKVTWQNLYPGHAIEYDYVNHMYKGVYETELLEASLLTLFTTAALFISAMGLLGLSILTTQRSMKEIAIRKVNGATIRQLIAMLSWSFIKWVVVAFVIAVPISVYAMTQWLQPFAYQTEMSWWIFALAGSAAVIVAFISVFLQSFKATTTSPVEILRQD